MTTVFAKKTSSNVKIQNIPGLQASNGGRLVDIQARAVIYMPEQRAEPQPGRANIHGTGNQAHSPLQLNFSSVFPAHRC
ncbi:hypothetical protein JOB18_012571 [Solea senegalensis]|uniref:Uncharacterized protein n=1 Tax=Solea senegalensis TaxID=28829 RepID=A0AAV6RAG6_SOLSE|nr:hypothetical protein JOB18_012571 [Solea senegalensis]